MTAKYDKFIKALENLCRQHGVQIATSGYDAIGIWDLEDGRPPIYDNGLIDKTDDSVRQENEALVAKLHRQRAEKG
jgi:hypothetical protein